MSTAVIEKEALRELVADALDVEVEEVTDEANYIEDLGVDSLMGLEIMVQLEKTFGIKINEEEFKQITNFGQTYELLTRKAA
ncbi:acyl carrier protein [Streptomyces sp. LX-29]|uniref:acyl carrier protein n=1 Tax=unclassified Streptomyces TaxID=2593676 RepID=UPI0011856BAF|nr:MULTISPECIES: acyl carrier protein [unclassified Streptomyces]TVL88956.1 polyketide-8 synthase acyl carrier protein [Streptomyces sp. SAJ15]WFB08807.1 acyl carrier protein [Streptomyces sp. LX-29]